MILGLKVLVKQIVTEGLGGEAETKKQVEHATKRHDLFHKVIEEEELLEGRCFCALGSDFV